MKKLKDLTNAKEISISELMALKGGMMENDASQDAGCDRHACGRGACESQSCVTQTCSSQACRSLMDCQTRSA